MQSVLRRSTGTGEGVPPENGILSFGTLKVDLRAHRVWLDENELEFTTMEFSILTLFMKNPGVVFGREQLMEKLRGIEWDVYNRSIDVLMSKLRQKLGDNPKNPRFFKTIWGAGYLFLGDSHEAHSNS